MTVRMAGKASIAIRVFSDDVLFYVLHIQIPAGIPIQRVPLEILLPVLPF